MVCISTRYSENEQNFKGFHSFDYWEHQRAFQATHLGNANNLFIVLDVNGMRIQKTQCNTMKYTCTIHLKGSEKENLKKF